MSNSRGNANTRYRQVRPSARCDVVFVQVIFVRSCATEQACPLPPCGEARPRVRGVTQESTRFTLRLRGPRNCSMCQKQGSGEVRNDKIPS
eukprot:3829853-Rhodomonas_salina.1